MYLGQFTFRNTSTNCVHYIYEYIKYIWGHMNILWTMKLFSLGCFSIVSTKNKGWTILTGSGTVRTEKYLHSTIMIAESRITG